jgi:ketosteroid isomerase-like protein
MSQENVEVVQRQFQACRDGALDEAAKYWHPDIEWRAIEGAADDVGIIRGEGGLRRYYQDWIDTMDAMEAHVEEVLFHGDERVAAVVRNSGRGRASGVLTKGRYYVACTVRDGRIVSGREYETRAQALEAVGQSE